MLGIGGLDTDGPGLWWTRGGDSRPEEAIQLKSRLRLSPKTAGLDSKAACSAVPIGCLIRVSERGRADKT